MNSDNIITSKFVHPDPLPLIKVKGSHREIGRQIGEACKEKIHHHLNNAHVLIDTTYGALELTWEGAQMQARKYIPFAQERYPQYVEEMIGISEGAGELFQ